MNKVILLITVFKQERKQSISQWVIIIVLLIDYQFELIVLASEKQSSRLPWTVEWICFFRHIATSSIDFAVISILPKYRNFWSETEWNGSLQHDKFQENVYL